MSTEVDISRSTLDSWYFIESRKPKKSISETIPKEQLVTTVVTKVIEDYDKEITPLSTSPRSPAKEFVVQESGRKNGATTNGSAGWFQYLLTSLSGWLVTQSTATQEKEEEGIPEQTEELWQDWEWVLSKTEEFATRQTHQDSTRIKEELKHLRKTAKALQFRSYFLSRVVSPLFSLLKNTQEAKDLATELDASKTAKIISDLIIQMEDGWLDFIHVTFFGSSEDKWEMFKENYKEKPYERNVVGSLKELAFSAAHGLKNNGITERVLVDILWSLWKTLSEVIRNAIGNDLTQEQLTQLADEVAKVKDPLVILWIETVRKSRSGRSREGQLVEKWKKDKETEENRLKDIKRRGVDARYEVVELPMLQQPSEPENQVNIRSLKKFLEQKLTFPTAKV